MTRLTRPSPQAPRSAAPTRRPDLAAAIVCALLVTAAAGCSSDAPGVDAGHDAGAPETRWQGLSDKGSYGVKVRTTPTPPPAATLFTLEAEIFAPDLSTPATVTQVAVDAWMPQHKHGMEGFTPQTTLSKDTVGGVTTQGMFFTMPGQWELRIDIKQGAHGADRVVLPVYVDP